MWHRELHSKAKKRQRSFTTMSVEKPTSEEFVAAELLHWDLTIYHITYDNNSVYLKIHRDSFTRSLDTMIRWNSGNKNYKKTTKPSITKRARGEYENTIKQETNHSE